MLCPNRKAYAELCRIITNARRRSSKDIINSLNGISSCPAKHCFILWLPQQKTEDTHWGQWLSQHHSGRLWIGLPTPKTDRSAVHRLLCGAVPHIITYQ
ncbi:hypothetical protein OK016_02965 [Vibrio chagasii]|nr:hypothetical protein [Vibrio chagasii]